jgi:hypothetical protein
VDGSGIGVNVTVKSPCPDPSTNPAVARSFKISWKDLSENVVENVPTKLLIRVGVASSYAVPLTVNDTWAESLDRFNMLKGDTTPGREGVHVCPAAAGRTAHPAEEKIPGNRNSRLKWMLFAGIGSTIQSAKLTATPTGTVCELGGFVVPLLRSWIVPSWPMKGKKVPVLPTMMSNVPNPVPSALGGSLNAMTPGVTVIELFGVIFSVPETIAAPAGLTTHRHAATNAILPMAAENLSNIFPPKSFPS